MSQPKNELATREQDIRKLMGEVAPDAEDEEAVQRALVERILAAETLADTFQDLTTIATKELKGRPLAVRDCRLMESQIEGSRGVYMLLDCVDLTTGEALVANTGAPQIMAVVWGAKQHGFLPVEVEVTEAKAAKPGKDAPLKLVPIGQTLQAIEGSRKQRETVTA